VEEMKEEEDVLADTFAKFGLNMGELMSVHDNNEELESQRQLNCRV
jgi:hypothetical protein